MIPYGYKIENGQAIPDPETAPKICDPQATWVDEIVVRDGNLISSQGPATAYAFAYALVDALGVDSEPVKQRMVYYNAFDVERGE